MLRGLRPLAPSLDDGGPGGERVLEGLVADRVAAARRQVGVRLEDRRERRRERLRAGIGIRGGRDRRESEHRAQLGHGRCAACLAARSPVRGCEHVVALDRRIASASRSAPARPRSDGSRSRRVAATSSARVCERRRSLSWPPYLLLLPHGPDDCHLGRSP
jgi:hypothetical protein